MPAMLTPYDKGAAQPTGRNLFRKQLLPIAKIDYKGRTIDFTREYLSKLVKAFHDGAYDFVPFQMAPHGNEHTNDPERTRGEIAALELTDDGLDVIVAASDAGAEVLRANPKLGVSARITEDYSRSDGRHFPAAIQHVLGTLDPRIPGMRPWQAVEAANDDDGEVIDLTALDYATDDPEPEPAAAAPVITQPEETSMALTADQEARLAKLLDLPDEQFEALLAPVQDADTETGTEPEDTEGDGEDELLTQEDLDALLAELPEDETADDAEPVLAGAGAELSAEARDAIELANARADEQAAELRRMRSELDRATFEKERDHYTRQGVPLRFVEMARPLLEGTGRTVDLANGKSADAGAITRKLLGEFAKTMTQLGLSVELGNPEGADEEAAAAEQEASERDSIVAATRSQFGL